MSCKFRTGWLWFDNDAGKTLKQKIARAVQAYTAKFGHAPNVCYVHPQAMQDTPDTSVDGVSVETARNVLAHHFWLGVCREGE